MLNAYDPSTVLTPNEAGVYEIYTVDQLCLLSQMVADGTTFSGKTVRLMTDIDMKGRTFQPIGGNGASTNFKGTFDGNYHTVKNLLIHAPGVERVGFFGSCNGATITNFGIENGTVFGGKACAGLVGLGNSVTIRNCFNRANVISSDGYCGGLVGQMGGTSTVYSSYNNGYVDSAAGIAGGVVGYISSSSNVTINACYHVGTLTDTAGKTGMIGFYNTGSTNPISSITVKNCRSTAAIKSSSITDNTSLESYSGNSKRTAAQMVSAATAMSSAYIYDCEWINSGYPVLTWQSTTTLPEDLVLTTAAQLRLVAFMVNKGEDTFSGKTIRLGNDIDLNSREWTPIGGNGVSDSGGNSFKGTFDGQGYTVSNMKISTSYYYVGFFGYITGTVQNFGIQTGSVTGANKAGGLAGCASGTISGCYSHATVSGTTYAGGLVGMAGNAVIENSYAKADVTATSNAGGLVAYYSSNTTKAKITNSYSACTLNGKNNGGLVCSINSAVPDTGVTITNSYALSGPSLIYSTTGYTAKSSSSQSAANLKAKADALGSAFRLDSYIPQNGGYPTLNVNTYKSPNMAALTPAADGSYEIYTAQDLRRLAYMVNEADTTFSGKTVRLMADIDLQNIEWIPIGGNAPADGASSIRFCGTFDGCGHKVSNLTVSEGNFYVGFFGDLSGATVMNFGIESGTVMGDGKVGGIAGTTRGNVTILNCYNKANVCGKNTTGGIVGMVSGSNCVVENCYNAGAVGANATFSGIVGYYSGSAANSVIRNCYNSGNTAYGILGSAATAATGSAENCYTVDTAEAVGTANSVVVTGAQKISAADLRSSVSSLGSAFTVDSYASNRMFPVLTWEIGDRATTLTETDGVYRIGTADELRLLSSMVRQGNTFSGKTVELTADIDLKNQIFLPIGGKDETKSYTFKGTFDGKGHVIRNLNVWESPLGYGGLFGIVNNAVIQNVGIESGMVMGATRSAAFAANAQSGTVIRNCYNKAMVYADSNTGAFVGMIGGANVVLENCYNTGIINAEKNSSTTAGLVGYLASNATNAKLVNCYNVGNYYGIIGSLHESTTGASTENCYSVGSIKAVRVPKALTTVKTELIGADTLRGYAAVLGEAYEEDVKSLNQGYPVLTWENTPMAPDVPVEPEVPEEKDPIMDESLKLGHTLNLASDISMNYVLSKSLLSGYDMDTVYLEITIPVYESNDRIGTETVTILPVENGNYYYFTLTGLTAVHMNNKLSSVLYGTKEGQVYYSAADEYSVATYAYSQLSKAGTADSLKTLCADLLRYGSAAQIYKSYRTDSLADSSMTAEHLAYLSDMEAVTFGNTNETLTDLENPVITWAGKALNLESKVAIKYIFNLGDYTGKVEDLTLKVHYINYAGTVSQVVLTGAELYNANRNQYAFSFDGLLAAELRTVVDVAIYAGGTQLSPTLRYSPDTYGNNKESTLSDLCKALFAYSDSAKAYFVK